MKKAERSTLQITASQSGQYFMALWSAAVEVAVVAIQPVEVMAALPVKAVAAVI